MGVYGGGMGGVSTAGGGLSMAVCVCVRGSTLAWWGPVKCICSHWGRRRGGGGILGSVKSM